MLEMSEMPEMSERSEMSECTAGEPLLYQKRMNICRSGLLLSPLALHSLDLHKFRTMLWCCVFGCEAV